MSERLFFSNEISKGTNWFKRRLNSTVFLWLILLFGAVLRIYDLGGESYVSDEMYTVIEAQQSVHQMLTSGRLDQPPAYYLPLILWAKIFGLNEVSTRSFSVLTGLGSIVLVYLVGRELFDKRVGLVGAFLMAISGIQIYYSQTARYYSFFELATLLSFLFFVLSLRDKKIIHRVLFVVSSILMVYSHAFGVFILAAQNLFFVFQRKNTRNDIAIWFFCQAIILFAILPYFYPLFLGGNVVESALSNTSITPPPPIWEPVATPFRLVLPNRYGRSWLTVIVSFIAAIAFLAAGAWIYISRQGKRNWMDLIHEVMGNFREIPDVATKLFMVGCWLLCPILLPFILSWMVAPIFNQRYMIGAAPALYLLIGLVLLNIRRAIPLFISLGALLIIVVPGLYSYYVTDVKDQWKEVAAYVEQNSSPNDVIVFPNDSDIGDRKGIKHESLYWYYRGDLQSCSVNIRPVNSNEIMKPLMQCIAGHDRFWLISHDFDPEVNDRIRSFFLTENHNTMHVITERQFVGLVVYLFELAR